MMQDSVNKLFKTKMFKLFKKKKESFTRNNSMRTDVKTRRLSIIRHYLKEEDLLSMIEEGEVFDKDTWHKTTKEGVELKYCPWCKKWLPLNHFNRDKSKKDDLTTRCKKCEDKRRRAIKAEKEKQEKTKNQLITNNVDMIECKNDDNQREVSTVSFDMIEGMREILKQLEEEIVKNMLLLESLTEGPMNKANDSPIAKNELTEKDVIDYINTHSIAPRVLFNAIAKYDDRYVFYCKDKVTGLTSPIKTELQK